MSNNFTDNNSLDNVFSETNSSNDGSIIYPSDNGNDLSDIPNTTSTIANIIDNDIITQQLFSIIQEKNTLITSLRNTNLNYSDVILELNNVITNIRKSVNTELDRLNSEFDKEEYALLKQDNITLENELKRYKDSEKMLINEIDEITKSYKILNVSYASKVREIIDVKTHYIENIINLKKTNQTMLINFSERIDALQYKLRDKTHEVSMSCRVCYSNSINVMLVPCNHLVMCKACIIELSKIDTVDFKCPLCQEDITDFMDVYLPE